MKNVALMLEGGARYAVNISIDSSESYYDHSWDFSIGRRPFTVQWKKFSSNSERITDEVRILYEGRVIFTEYQRQVNLSRDRIMDLLLSVSPHFSLVGIFGNNLKDRYVELPSHGTIWLVLQCLRH
jgi:hypothetical protein